MRSKGIARTVHLLVPGVLTRLGEWAQAYGEVARVPELERLLARAQGRASPGCGFEETLCAVMGLAAATDSDLPLGALRRYGLSGEQDGGFFLAADPVHLRADISQLFLVDSAHLDITEAEGAALVSAFNEHFTEQGLRLEKTARDAWHVALAQPEPLRTHPLRTVMGRAINAYLPTGTRRSFWQGLLNEVQMLFHSAAVNRQRESQGALPINSLWLYGAGSLPEKPRGDAQAVTAIWADDPLAHGVARWADVEASALPANVDTVLRGARQGTGVVCLEQLQAPASYNDLAAWEGAMNTLERDWFGPLNAALKGGALGECHLHDCAGQGFVVRAGGAWRFLKKVKPLYTFANPEGPR